MIDQVLDELVQVDSKQLPRLDSSFVQELKLFLVTAIDAIKDEQCNAPDILADSCFKVMKKKSPAIYIPGFLERLGQNILPRHLIGLVTAYKSTDKKYEDFRRIREEFPLRTVNLHVGPIGTIDFKKATQLARTMDAIGYADTIGHIINYDLGHAPRLANYYQQVNDHFETIYRALLISTGNDPYQNSFLKQLREQSSPNNRFETIKSYVIHHATSQAAFSFTRAIEYQDGLINKNTLLKETYLESFKSKFFARSQFFGQTFYKTSSLESLLDSRPDLINSLSSTAKTALKGSRMEQVAAQLEQLKPVIVADLADKEADNSATFGSG
ncbi:MAG: hypothetical protein PSV35_00555 [bacterium]|nr:hypothetical protein [bacterium]